MKKISLTKTLLLSAATATAVAFFTPNSGKELREKLKDKAKKATEKGQQKADDLVHDMKDSYHEAEDEMNRNSSHPKAQTGSFQDPEDAGLVSPEETDIASSSDDKKVTSTREKGEEWLDQVGEEQDSLGEYPDASGVNPGGLLSDDADTLPGGGPAGVDFLGGISASADPLGVVPSPNPTSALVNEENVTHSETKEDANHLMEQEDHYLADTTTADSNLEDHK